MMDLTSVPNFVLINELERRVAEGIITANVSFDYDQDQNAGELEQNVKEGWDKLNQQEEEPDNAMKDLENTRSRVMDNIAKRHAAFHEEMERLKKEGIGE